MNEEDFLPCSFGFRPGRSVHQALQHLRAGLMGQRLRWVIDIDIEKYFESIPHAQLRDFLDQRVTDGVIRRAPSLKRRCAPDPLHVHLVVAEDVVADQMWVRC